MFVGRVVCDAEGRLNANSLLLEGTLKHSHGASVKLDVSRLTAYRLFPGQARDTCPKSCSGSFVCLTD